MGRTKIRGYSSAPHSEDEDTPKVTSPSPPPPKRSRKVITQKVQIPTPAEDSLYSSPSPPPKRLEKLPVRKPESVAHPSQPVPEANPPASPVQSEEKPSLSGSPESDSEESQSEEHSDPAASGQERLLRPILPLAEFEHLNIERSSKLEYLEKFKVLPILQKMGWEKLLSWGGKTYPSLAKGMYCSIRGCPALNTIEIEFQNGEIALITPQLVSELIGIPMYKNGYLPKIPSLVPVKDKDKFTKKLCGRKVAWKIWMGSAYLLPKYKILHLLFTYNVYPCFGNKSDLTGHMAHILYFVATGKKLCLPSLMCSTIIKYWKSTGHGSPPYCFLMSQLAQHFGVKHPMHETPSFTKILDDSVIEKYVGTG